MKYAYQEMKENMARATTRDVGISMKVAVEICSAVRGMQLDKAKAFLERVLDHEEAVPYKKFTNGVGHRPGKMGAGRYPLKATTELISLLESVEANAKEKSLGKLKIVHVCAQRAGLRWHNGRQRRRRHKATHLEVVVEETEKKKPKMVKKTKKVEDVKTKTNDTQKKNIPVKEEVKNDEKKKVEHKNVAVNVKHTLEKGKVEANQ